MEAGIVGLPNVGKSTLFNALTSGGAEASNYPFCTIEPNVGIVSVPDPNLEIIHHYVETKKVVPAILKIVDIAGLVKGASQGEGLGNKFLSHIREVDAILHVVRCFADENVTHVDGAVDPIRDITTIDTELMLSDLQIVEASIDKSKRTAKGGDKEAILRMEVMEKCLQALSQGKPVRSLVFEHPDEKKIVKLTGLMTSKKILYIANVDESDPTGAGEHVQKVRQLAAEQGGRVVPVCAKIESELAELDEKDRVEMLASLGMKEPALHAVAREAYALLGLQSYYTAGEIEVRAWTIPVGATAPQAAGVIHSDFERGFIRVEVYQVADLQQFKTEAAIRSAGKLRTEGKTYVMQNGDVCHFLFNV